MRNWCTLQLAPAIKRTQPITTFLLKLSHSYGCLREEFFDPHRSSGIWGREVNDKCFQVLETLTVDAQGANGNVANELLSRMLCPAATDHDGLAFAWAKPASVVIKDSSDWTEVQKIALFRQLGYRRVGDTPWFAKAYDPFHAANVMAIDKDYDPPAKFVDTYLQRLENRLEISRTRKTCDNGTIVDISAHFRGHTDTNARALLTARKTENHPIALTLEQTKYGCTCGRCVGGYISPRMRFILVKMLAKIDKGVYTSVASKTIRELYVRNPSMAINGLGGYAWSVVEEDLRGLIYQMPDIGLGYCFVSRPCNLSYGRITYQNIDLQVHQSST